MKKYLVISLSLLAFLVFSAKKCESPENEYTAKNETAISTALDSLKTSFEAGQLSTESLKAFEEKAKQKLIDLADYLHIITDKSLDQSFKDQAMHQLSDLFISDTVTIGIRLSKKADSKPMVFNAFLKYSYSTDFNSIDFLFDSISVSETLHLTHENQYSGKLNFIGHFKGYQASDTTISSLEKKTADIVAIKINKRFGNDTLQVWQVFLGNIH